MSDAKIQAKSHEQLLCRTEKCGGLSTACAWKCACWTSSFSLPTRQGRLSIHIKFFFQEKEAPRSVSFSFVRRTAAAEHLHFHKDITESHKSPLGTLCPQDI
jgi:hypothetical protein